MPREKDVISINEAAGLLGVSSATVKNWIKHEYLIPVMKKNRMLFYYKDVKDLKKGIKNGSVNRLKKGANKIKAGRTFIPEEYINNKRNSEIILFIVNYLKESGLPLESALFVLSINLLIRKNFILSRNLNDIIGFRNKYFNNLQVKKELCGWFNELNDFVIDEKSRNILSLNLPDQRDLLGLIYQSLLKEGLKSSCGSYYTPESVVKDIVKEHCCEDARILDPCCGTGQFLTAFSERTGNPENLYGIDIDPVAVKIARINLIMQYGNFEFAPKIFHGNTLLNIHHLTEINDRRFDIIATNPPWGLHFSGKDLKLLREYYPGIRSGESFSFFLRKSLDLLTEKGKIMFILPESLLNVGYHSDIRNYILDQSEIKKIKYLGRIFKNVFSPVVRLDLEKNRNKPDSMIKIEKDGREYYVSQKSFKKNSSYVFTINADEKDISIINKVLNTKHLTLKNNARWGLGIVTGNNKKYLLQEKLEGYEEIITGKDIEKFIINEPENYIRLDVEKFQQVAPIYKYRAKEKLVYKFITSKPVFAYDDRQRLTLNSANFVIPELDNYPVKVILALFNSVLYQFLFKKKFASIKVLRSHIEELPLPLWSGNILQEIVLMADNILSGSDCRNELDLYIMRKMGLNDREIDIICKAV